MTIGTSKGTMSTSSRTTPAQLQPLLWSLSGGKKHILGNICPPRDSRSLWLSPVQNLPQPSSSRMAVFAAPPGSKASDDRTRLPDLTALGRASVPGSWGYGSAVSPPDGPGAESEQEFGSRQQTPSCPKSRRSAARSSVCSVRGELPQDPHQLLLTGSALRGS